MAVQASWNVLVDEVPVDGVAPDTRIDTPTGAVAAEALREGDAVLIDGGVGVVAWVGQFRPRPRDGKRIEALRPILVAAEALGSRRPRRPVVVAPDQALQMAGPEGPVLVAARHLVNNVSVRRLQASGAIDYVQIALRVGACLLAEGMPVRGADTPEAVGADPLDRRPGVARSGAALAWASGEADVRAKLQVGPLRGLVERVGGGFVAGWAIDRADPDRAVAIELVIDGEVVAAGLADRPRPDVGIGFGHTACGFRLAWPAGLSGLHDFVVRRAGGAEMHRAAVLLGSVGGGAAVERAAAVAGLLDVIAELRGRAP